MEKEKLYKKLNNKEYEELERELKNEYSENRNLETKYQLGICYGEQFNKIENAEFNFEDIGLIRILSTYLSGEKADLNEINSLIIDLDIQKIF